MPAQPDISFVWGAVCGAAGTLVLLLLIRALRPRVALDRPNRRVDSRTADEARTDPLTGIGNRRRLRESVAPLLTQRGRSRRRHSMLFIDIDRFKNVNDAYGHLAGDAVLRHVAGMLNKSTREPDEVTRVGGDEFVVFLVDTQTDGALCLAERIRQTISATPVRCNAKHVSVTVSVGVTDSHATDTIDTIFARADRALLQAKHAGRNCSHVLAAHDSELET